MNKKYYSFAFLVLLLLQTLSASSQPDLTNDTKFCRTPAISKDYIAFVYANDLWIADRDGSNPRMLTSDEGSELSPVFSPDGKYIAFSAEYDGNTDVYILPVEGGIPKRTNLAPRW